METSKSLLAVLFFMCFISASSAYVFTVGGRIGWVENPPVPYSSWSGGMRFIVNDTLVFNYKQGDSVLLVNKESYDSCNITNPLQKLDSGVYKLDHSGPHYFISGAAGHCSNGEKLLVVVLAIRSPPSPPALSPPAPAPAPVVSPAPSSLSPSPSPVSVTVPAPAPSSLSPSPSPASVTTPTPAPSSAPTPAPSSLSPSPSPASVPALGPSSVSPAPSSSSPSPSPGSVPVTSPPQPGSAPSGSPSGSLAPPPSTNSSPVLRMSSGLVALVIGCTLMI